MANLLNRIPTNLTEYPNSFKRQGAFPLEAYSVFYNMADAEAYAASNPIAYVGQTLAVVTANATDSSVVDSVVFYVIADAAGTLQVVGKTYVGDEKSIQLDVDGETNIFSLKGFNDAGATTIPQKLPVFKKDAEGNDTTEIDHYELHWVTIDQVVEKDNYSNTKAEVKAAEGEGRVLVTQSYDEANDKYTYKLALDLSDLESSINDRFETVNTSIEGLGTSLTNTANDLTQAIADAKADVEGELADVKADLEAADEAVLLAAKGYADDHKTNIEAKIADEKAEITNAYTTLVSNTKTELQNKIDSNGGEIDALESRAENLEGRMTSAEAAIGTNAANILKEASDRQAAISQEQADRASAISGAKTELKTYTDDEIAGLEVAIEKKENIDYLVIKNKAGTEVASVDASAFVKDSFLENVVYDSESGDITFSFVDNTDNKSDIVVNVKDLVDIYTANDETGIHVVDNKFSIDHNIIATVSHVADVKADVEAQISALNTSAGSALTTAVETINNTIAETNAAVALKAEKSYVDTELAKKLDKETYNTNRAADLKACEDNMAAHVVVMGTELDKKVDKTTYTTDMSNLNADIADKVATINAGISAAGGRIDETNTRIGNVEKDLDDNYYTKTETDGIIAEINSAAEALGQSIATLSETVNANETDAEAKISALGDRVGGLETSVVKKVKVGDNEYTPDNNRLVTIPTADIASQINVGDLKDGAAYKQSVADAIANEASARESADSTLASSIASAGAAIQANSAAIAANKANIESNDADIAGILADIENHKNNVHSQVNSKIQALENSVNGVEGESDGLIKTVAAHGVDIAGLKSTDTTLSGRIDALVADKANKSDVETTVGQLNADIADRVTKTDFDTFKTANTQAIEGVKTDLGKETTARTEGDTAVKKYVDDNFYTMAAANGKFLATDTYEGRIQSDVLGIVNDAIGLADKEGGATVSTLVKLVEWVDEHVGDFGTFIDETEKGIADNAAAINANAEAIANNADEINNVKSDLTTLTSVVGQNKIKESTEISVGTPGEGGTELGIKQVNVNKLVQTEILVLNGGSASTTVSFE